MSVERQAIAGLKWTAAAKILVQAISWAITLVVLRLLSPDDYGLMASVSVITTIVALIAEMGFGAAIVQSPELKPDDIRKLGGLSLLVGLLSVAVLTSISPLVAMFFRDQRLVALTIVASFQFAVSGAVLVPGALASRNLEFKKLAIVEMIGGVVASGSTLVLAWLNTGVWSLVVGALIAAIVRAVILFVICPKVSPLFRFAGIGHHFTFGGTLMINRIGYLIVSQADMAIAGRFLSKDAVGHYAVSIQLATLPMQKIMGIINQITLPAISRMQHDLPRVQESILKALSILALVSIPVLWGMSAVSEELVQAVLGPKWSEAAISIRLISLVVPARMLATVINTAVLGLGNKGVDILNTIASIVVLPIALLIGVRWGPTGLAAAWAISFPLLLSITLPRVAAALGLGIGRICGAIVRPVICGLLMYAAVELCRQLLPESVGIMNLLVLISVGAITYGVSTYFIAGDVIRNAIRGLRGW